MKPVTAILIGAGQRGMNTYATYALEHPDEIRFVGICEPDERRRSEFSLVHNIDPDNAWANWNPNK
ncbi:hypothetical protein [Cohnella yongneupensis]|uniref:Gfo/Idh/MocA-like oxidoreductase N-terminal domain-containing protein n=1 Tax=Cohnella yongneupensis TaxID=425006 RepID=A0ABW0QUP1_9BACL